MKMFFEFLLLNIMGSYANTKEESDAMYNGISGVLDTASDGFFPLGKNDYDVDLSDNFWHWFLTGEMGMSSNKNKSSVDTDYAPADTSDNNININLTVELDGRQIEAAITNVQKTNGARIAG